MIVDGVVAGESVGAVGELVEGDRPAVALAGDVLLEQGGGATGEQDQGEEGKGSSEGATGGRTDALYTGAGTLRTWLGLRRGPQVGQRGRGRSRRPPACHCWLPRPSLRCRPVVADKGLFIGSCSVTTTRRRRFMWVAWWTAPPVREPFRKPDAFSGGARSPEEALAQARRAAGVPLVEIESYWARAWARVLIGRPPWSARAEGAGGSSAHKRSGGSTTETMDDRASPTPTSIWRRSGSPRTQRPTN